MKYLLPLFWIAATPALADTASIPCPDNKPCKVVTIDDQEMKILAGQNGILQTAAQARSLDLGQFVIYFQNKLQNAPAGEVKPAAVPAPEGNPALGGERPPNPAAVTPSKEAKPAK